MTHSIGRRRRDGYYDRLYGERKFSIESKLKKGVWYLQAVDPKTRKNFGRPFSKDGRTHHLLYKSFPDKFPPYKDFVAGNKRLVKQEKRNITSSFKSKDWKDLGFATAKQGQYFVRALKLPVKTQEDLENIKQVYSKMDDKSIFKQPHKLDQYSRRLLKLFKNNLGRFNVKDTGSQFKGSHLSYEITRVGVYRDVYIYLNNIKKFILRKILQYMSSNGSCKFNFSITIMFKRKLLMTNEVVSKEAYFFSEPLVIANKGEISSKVSQSMSRIIEKVNKMVQSGSGWVVDSIQKSHVNIYKNILKTGSSYFELPKCFYRKVINIKNQDNRCFLYSLLVGLHKNELNLSRTDRLNQFDKFFDMYPFDYNDMPMTCDVSSKIRKYEDIIKRNINILIWTAKTGINRHYITDNNYEDTIELMLCHNEETGQYHYVYVPNLSRLLTSTLTKSHKTLHFCKRCLSSFYSEEKLNKHLEICKINDLSRTIMPEKDHMSFSNIKAQQKLPFAVYADFECLLCPTNLPKEEGNNHTHSCSHKPCGAKYIITSIFHKKPIRSFFDRSSNCVRLMLDNLIKDCHELHDEYFKNPKSMMPLTKEEEQEFRFGKRCHICNKGDFVNGTSSPNSRVRDHCHFTGKFRGLAHHSCNINLKVEKLFPVFFHNLKGYDSNFIIQALQTYDGDDISCIPMNSEKFISFSIKFSKAYKYISKNKELFDKLQTDYCNKYNVEELDEYHNKQIKRLYFNEKSDFEIRFLDSCSFLSSSLEALAKNLNAIDFRYTMEFVKRHCSWVGSPEEVFKLFCLLKRKGIYPYEYMTCWDKFYETKLPTLRHFISVLRYETKKYSKLAKKDQAELKDDYKHAKVVWDAFKCKNLGDYHDLYLESDVCLLADIFEKFRNICIDKFQIDPCHYYTLPGFAFDACLKLTDTTLELFTEEKKDMYLTMEQSKIGGISGTGGKRYAKANNKYLKDYNPNQLSNYLMYADANGLYSWAMKQLLPQDEFEYYTDKFNLEEALRNIDGYYGYFITLDASIPKELHDHFNDYCPFPENIEISQDQYTPYQQKVSDATCKALNTKSVSERKLMPNLRPKKRYTIHIKLLKLFLELGCKIDKIHEVIRFHQSAWMSPYIELCMNERSKDGISEFEKDFWKLCCNAVFGKTMEDVRNRMKCEIVHDQEKFDKLINKNTFYNSTLLNDNGLVFVERKHTTVKLCKPIYVGVAILNISKYLMYDFFYNTLRKKYSNASLIYTDTDSFIFEVFTNDLYADILKDQKFLEQFDLSNYSNKHPMFCGMDKNKVKSLIKQNYKVVGKFKDEYGGKVVKEVVGLRAKMYSIIDENDEQKNTGKGVKKVILKNTEHQKYKDCLFHNFDIGKMIQSSSMNFIHSKNHKVYGEELTKITLSAFDDKKSILDDGITQLSWGHWRLDEMTKNNNFKL